MSVGLFLLVICYERFDCFALVFQKVESLTAIESKLMVTGKECQMLGDGMRNDDVVAGVAVIHSLVERKSGIGEYRVL